MSFILTQMSGFATAPLFNYWYTAATGWSTSASFNDSTATIVLPSVISRGDLIILIDGAWNVAGIPTAITPTGFTNIANDGLGIHRAMLSYKVATGSEAGATVTGMSGDSINRKIAKVFRPNAQAAVTISGINHQITDSAPTNQTIAVGSAVKPLIALMAAYQLSGVTGRSFTIGGSDAKDSELTAGTNIYLIWKIVNSAPSDIVAAMGDNGNANCLQSCYITGDPT